MMSRPPTGGGLRELTPRQQRRQQFLQRRGRQFQPGGRVQAQPTEMPQQELTPRQQRRQQFLQRRDARRERAVADYRAQQQAPQMPRFVSDSGMPIYDYMGQLPEGLAPNANVVTGQVRDSGINYDLSNRMGQLPPGMSAGEMTNVISGQGMGMVAGGNPNQFQPQRVDVPQGMSIEQMQQQTPSPAFVNQMPGQLRTGTFTPQGMYRPLPFYASPQQIRERQALIETGGYFDQPTPAQRMR